MNVYEKLTDPVALTLFGLTLLLPIAVGVVAFRRTRNQADFFVGGRAMNRFVVALSAVSSGRSAWLVLGLIGIAYKTGIGAVWAIVGYITAEALQFVSIGARLRAATQAQGDITLLDYFESRFADRRHLLRLTGAVVIGVFITAYVAAQLNGGAKTLSAALHLPMEVALIIAGLLIAVYMVLGGYVAVAYNDVIRALIMLIGLVVLPTVAVVELGGPGVLVETLARLHPKYIDPLSAGLGVIVGFVGIGLGSPGQPHVVVRYMSIDDPANLKLSALVGTLWNILLGLGAVFTGMLGRAMIPDVGGLPNQDPEMTYLVLSSQHFGPALYGLLVGGVFAAILSTVDSQLLVLASTFGRDIYEKVWKKGVSSDEAQKLRLSRAVVIAATVVAIALAWAARDLVFWLVLFAWGGLGAALGPALILALYWKRATKLGVFAGMVTGAVVVVGWKHFLKAATGVYELVPAFFGALAAIVVVSLIHRERR